MMAPHPCQLAVETLPLQGGREDPFPFWNWDLFPKCTVCPTLSLLLAKETGTLTTLNQVTGLLG